MTREFLAWVATILTILTLPATAYFVYLAFVWRSHTKRLWARRAFAFVAFNTIVLTLLRMVSLFLYYEPWFLMMLAIYSSLTYYIVIALAGFATKVLERRIREAELSAPPDLQKTSEISKALLTELRDLGVKSAR